VIKELRQALAIKSVTLATEGFAALSVGITRKKSQRGR
jgi:hypothetical protein